MWPVPKAGPRALVWLPLLLVLALGLTSCAQIMRDDSGGGPATATATTPAPGGPQGPVYYVSPSGKDSAAGTSPATAWRTLRRASRAALAPGTELLLQGGRRFTGPLEFDKQDAGSASRPVRVASYGQGRATIVARSGSGIAIFDTAGIDIENLAIAGTAKAFRNGDGIVLYSDLSRNRKLDHIVITRVDISGFSNGISMGGGKGSTGFRDVTISYSQLHANLDAGLTTYGPVFDARSPAYANENVSVSHVQAFRNRGDRSFTAHNTGSGIVLGSVRDGIISWSTAYGNGGNEGSHQGPDGIWAYDSTHIAIEHDLAYQNHTNDATDGDGFGLDQNTSDSVMQYNLSYRNDGAGYLLYTSLNNGAQTHNVVRFNISSADVHDQNGYYGGISVLGFVKNSAVYQNTVIMAPQTAGMVPALQLSKYVSGDTVHNNLFAVHGGAVIAAKGDLRPGQAELQGNDYYSALPWSVNWDGSLYSSMPAWRSATGEETLNGHPVGLDANPDLTGPYLGLGLTAPGGTGAGFILRRGSPLLHAGLDLRRLFGLDPGPVNYAGTPISAKHLNIGAL